MWLDSLPVPEATVMTDAESAFLAYVRSLKLRREQEYARALWAYLHGSTAKPTRPVAMSHGRATTIYKAVQGVVAS
jgi:hypothetical protein